MERGRDLISSDTLNLIGVSFYSFAAALGCVDGAHWIAGNDFDIGILFLQVFACAAYRATRPCRCYKVCHPSLSLVPNLRPCCVVMDFGIDGIVELIREDRVGSVLHYLFGFHHVVVRMIRRNRRRRYDHLGTKSL